jgi:NADP-dependent 3-hydroxy acid dehydrogenase YdfG
MLDVTDQDSIEQCISKIDDIDILVNNAGTLTPGGFKDQNAVDTLQKNLDVNVFGVLKMTQAIFPKIQEKSFGAIVNIVSM